LCYLVTIDFNLRCFQFHDQMCQLIGLVGLIARESIKSTIPRSFDT
jgi:hypothetical protein